jgi:spermidine synthase
MSARPREPGEVGWVDEDGMFPFVRLSLRMRLIARTRSAYQDIEVFEHPQLGRVLMLDGVFQTSSADAAIYHEMLAWVPLSVLDEACGGRVAILGGGDGALLREVLQWPALTEVVVAELDPAVVELCRAHLGVHGDFEDPRVTLRIGDARAYVAEAARARHGLDLLLVDLSAPPATLDSVFDARFVEDVHAALAPGGRVCQYVGSRALQADLIRATAARYRAEFGHVELFRAAIPTYVGGDSVFLVAGDGSSAQPRVEHRGLHYGPALHRAAFVSPGS